MDGEDLRGFYTFPTSMMVVGQNTFVHRDFIQWREYFFSSSSEIV